MAMADAKRAAERAADPEEVLKALKEIKRYEKHGVRHNSDREVFAAHIKRLNPTNPNGPITDEMVRKAKREADPNNVAPQGKGKLVGKYARLADIIRARHTSASSPRARQPKLKTPNARAPKIKVINR